MVSENAHWVKAHATKVNGFCLTTGKMRQPTPGSCPLIYTHTHTHTHIHAPPPTLKLCVSEKAHCVMANATKVNVLSLTPGGRGQSNPQSCPLAYTHTHTHTQN